MVPRGRMAAGQAPRVSGSPFPLDYIAGGTPFPEERALFPSTQKSLQVRGGSEIPRGCPCRMRVFRGKALEEAWAQPGTGQSLQDAALPVREGSSRFRGDLSRAELRQQRLPLPHRINPDWGLQLLLVGRVGVLVRLTDSAWRVLVNACYPLGRHKLISGQGLP